jgi:hypothetical protein
MKKIIIVLLTTCIQMDAKAQTEEVQQLLLNVEKLSQLKQILSDMKEGFVQVNRSYQTVKNIAQGNFDLHNLFLDQLLQVSPTVRKYFKVREIIDMQARIVRSCKTSMPSELKIAEINYAASVYKHLLKTSVQNIEDLAVVLTARQLRMNDEERLARIDAIHATVQTEMQFLQNFKERIAHVATIRKAQEADTKNVKPLIE